MYEDETLVPNDTENAEVAAEDTTGLEEPDTPDGQEPEKVYTEEDFNRKVDEVVGRRLARKEAKIRKEYDQRYGSLENVLAAGTGKQNVEDITNDFREFYESQGVKIPQRPAYSVHDLTVLAKAEAEDIINSGFSEVVEEVDRLAAIGTDRMSEREKIVFKALAEHRQQAEQEQELLKLGVTQDVYSSREFKDFARKFSQNTPISEVYEIYNKTQQQKEIQSMGSMKGNTGKDDGVKEFYTRDEALKFTRKDLDEKPGLMKAIEKSMLKW